ncbi:MAG: hypothetical protein A2104_03945 [Candidatus Melainabacteria bacterium GWF2_32_7]|nr:MAG: hypothetical protein A2104_03945 [Candidatus Melainabacteria bacterium GWF2_32_7]
MPQIITGYSGRYGNIGKNTDFTKGDNAARYGANVADNDSFIGINPAKLNSGKMFIPGGITKLEVLQKSSLAYANRSMDPYDSFNGKSISNADAGYRFLEINKDGNADDAIFVVFSRLKSILYGNDKTYADLNNDGAVDTKDKEELSKKLDPNKDGKIDDEEATKVGKIFDLNGDNRVSTAEKAADFIATDSVKGQDFQNGIIDREKEKMMECFRAAEIVESPNYSYGNWTKEFSQQAYDFYKLGEAEQNFVMPECNYRLMPNPEPEEI